MEAIERIAIAMRSRWTKRLPSALGGFDKDAVGCRSTRNGFSGELGDAPVLEVMKSISGCRNTVHDTKLQPPGRTMDIVRVKLPTKTKRQRFLEKPW